MISTSADDEKKRNFIHSHQREKEQTPLKEQLRIFGTFLFLEQTSNFSPLRFWVWVQNIYKIDTHGRARTHTHGGSEHAQLQPLDFVKPTSKDRCMLWVDTASWWPVTDTNSPQNKEFSAGKKNFKLKLNWWTFNCSFSLSQSWINTHRWRCRSLRLPEITFYVI